MEYALLESQFITKSDAARIKNCTRNTLDKYIDKKKIDVQKIGKKWLVVVNDQFRQLQINNLDGHLLGLISEKDMPGLFYDEEDKVYGFNLRREWSKTVRYTADGEKYYDEYLRCYAKKRIKGKLHRIYIGGSFLKSLVHKKIEKYCDKHGIFFTSTILEKESNKDKIKGQHVGEHSVNNLANFSKNPIEWKGMKFRSISEKRIAEALEKTGAIFFPNCMARILTHKGRQNVEPDFLVCVNGKWGILEVDGEPYHPASRSCEDHERDRIFRINGIFLIERFDARDCFNNPERVVSRFLTILKNL